MAVVETVKLSKHFNDVKAVDGIDITIQEGEFLVLLGPSGSGKTTLMRMIAGLEKPTGGTIKIGDRVVNDLPPRLRNVAMVFQSYALYPHMSVYNNIAFSLRPLGMTRQQIDDKVHWAARMFSIDHLLSRKPRQLSGGQRQRVALARAIVREPDVFLLDEPLSNLDAKLRQQLREDLRRIIKHAGVTALYVTHDQSEAVAVGDRIGVMREGRLLQIATPSELYNRPAELFVAEFTGASNLIAGRILRADAARAQVRIGSGCDLLSRVPRVLAPGTEVTVAVRPENLRLSRADAQAPPAGEWNRICAMVSTARFHGVQTGYTVEASGTSWEATEYGSVPQFSPGDAVSLWIPLDGCWAFAEKRSGAAAH